jgi:hypothetical protein
VLFVVDPLLVDFQMEIFRGRDLRPAIAQPTRNYETQKKVRFPREHPIHIV